MVDNDSRAPRARRHAQKEKDEIKACRPKTRALDRFNTTVRIVRHLRNHWRPFSLNKDAKTGMYTFFQSMNLTLGN